MSEGKENNQLIPLPHNDICVIDEKYLSDENSIFYFKTIGKFLNYKFIFEDINHKLLYKCDYNGITGSIALNDPKTDRALLKMKNKIHLIKPNEIVISSFKNDKEISTVTCSYKSKITFSNSIYRITFFNKATEKEELIEVECNGTYSNCAIYYGKQKENGIKICTFESSKIFTGVDFKIEILPRIDSLFINCVIDHIYHLIQGKKAA